MAGEELPGRVSLGPQFIRLETGNVILSTETGGIPSLGSVLSCGPISVEAPEEPAQQGWGTWQNYRREAGPSEPLEGSDPKAGKAEQGGTPQGQGLTRDWLVSTQGSTPS